MRMSVMDVGSRTVRLVIADVVGGVPLPVHTAKWKLRLADHLDPGGPVPKQCVSQLVEAVRAAAALARQYGAAEPLAFATAIVRAAPNRAEVLRAVRARTGVALCTLPGEVEGELTFLAARRWMGWRSGSLAVFDIGGGSLEVAFGRGRLPDFVASLPLGANRLTQQFLPGDAAPAAAELKALRREVRHQLRDAAARVRWEGPHTAVVTSRTFQQLGRLCGAAPGRGGPFVERALHLSDLRTARDRLAALSAADRADLPGISAPRAAQSLAGAVVGHTVMKLTGCETASICPWGIREGVLLRHVEDGPEWWADVVHDEPDAVTPNPATSRPLRVAATVG
ncbi:Ppx/GppA family phosphatase [Streptomyces sp. NPDC008150]|uniref:Ppx/GppA phosphatase family protein n=1 Tax=Streptomyces sp. NPDC008150 TaxID=3364816 RepID=UPI0036E5A0B5